MTGPVLDELVKCASCGHELKATALFCTSCGSKRSVEPALDDTACGACGTALKPGAGFCTECGVVVSSATGQADDVESTVKRVGRPSDRISPAASRAILESVGGGRGGYVGPRGVSSRTATSSAAEPPASGSAVSPTAADHDHKRPVGLIAAVAAVVVLLGVGAFVALRPKAESSTTARPSGVAQSATTVAPTTLSAPTTADTKEDDAKAAAAKQAAAEKEAAQAKKDAAEKEAAAAKKAAEERARAEAAQRAAQTSPPATQGPTQVAPPVYQSPRAPNTLAPSGGGAVAQLSAPSSVAVPGVITITNVGSATLTWQVVNVTWGGTSPSVGPRSGSLAPGASVNISVSWPPGANPTGAGRVDISSNGGSRSVSIHR